MKKLLLLSLFALPTIGVGAVVGTKNKPKHAGQFVNAATKSAVETVKAESTLIGKIDAFNAIPDKTHLAKLNPHILTLKKTFGVIQSPEQGNLETALHDSQKTVVGLLALRKTVKGKSAAAIDDILAQLHAIVALAAEKYQNTKEAQLFNTASKSIEQSLQGTYLASAAVPKPKMRKAEHAKAIKGAKTKIKRTNK
jgi:hypothetical protein